MHPGIVVQKYEKQVEGNRVGKRENEKGIAKVISRIDALPQDDRVEVEVFHLIQ